MALAVGWVVADAMLASLVATGVLTGPVQKGESPNLTYTASRLSGMHPRDPRFPIR